MRQELRGWMDTLPGTGLSEYLIGGAEMGMDVRLCAPESLWPTAEIRKEAEEIAAETGAHHADAGCGQGGSGRHAGRLIMLVVAALGGNALLKRGEPPDRRKLARQCPRYGACGANARRGGRDALNPFATSVRAVSVF